MTRHELADGGNGLQVWRVTANILNKQLRTSDKGGPLPWMPDEAVTIPNRKKLPCYETFHTASDLD